MACCFLPDSGQCHWRQWHAALDSCTQQAWSLDQRAASPSRFDLVIDLTLMPLNTAHDLMSTDSQQREQALTAHGLMAAACSTMPSASWTARQPLQTGCPLGACRETARRIAGILGCAGLTASLHEQQGAVTALEQNVPRRLSGPVGWSGPLWRSACVRHAHSVSAGTNIGHLQASFVS